jgi:hypothetical protein
MEQSKVQIELNKFRDYVIKQARTNLSKGGKNSSSKLYNSLGGTVKANPNSFEMEFFMEKYGVFQDAGVKGKDPSKVSPNAKIQGQQAPNSKYKFGSGSTGNYSQFVSSIEAWAKKKNIRFRDDKGKYKKGSYKSLSHVIAGNIYNRGLKPSLFFTKPFEAGFKRLPEDLVEAYGLDALTIFNEQIDEIING